MKPVEMDAQTLSAILHDMGDCVAANSSRSGTIEYDAKCASSGIFWVWGSYRTGSYTGHGSTRVIGEGEGTSP